MKVYIVSRWHQYEDTFIQGVYCSEEKAMVAAEAGRAEDYYDGVDVCGREVQE